MINNAIIKEIHKKETQFLLTFFIVIILIKIYLSLRFPTPIVFGDEYLYASYAKDIISNFLYLIVPDQFQKYPPGYPILLTPSFFFYPDMELVYRSMLIINSIFSSTILIISYFILKKFVPINLAILGSILIALLPINTLYSFIILSENLYIILYLLSGYFILISLEERKSYSLLHIFTGFILFFLTITRALGILAVISLLFIILYKLINETGEKIVFIKKNILLISTPIILLLIWKIITKIYGSNIYIYDSDIYIKSIFYSTNNIHGLILFLKLLIHEIDYLLVTSYFIFFVFFILILMQWKKLDESIKIYILYSFIYGSLSIVLTVFHMIIVVSDSNNPLNLNYLIWGRYIDPILPTIFIIGLISWNRFFIDPNHSFQKDILKKFIIAGTAITVIFIMTYPYNSKYSFINVMPIYYTEQIIKDSLYLFLTLPVMMLTLSLMLLRKPKILIAVLIVFSLVISIPSFQSLEESSKYVEHMNEIGRLLSYEKDKEDILMDSETFFKPYDMDHNLIQFWAMPKNLIYDSNISNPPNNIKYIISKKPLPFKISLVSYNGIIMYENKNASDFQIIPLEGLFDIEYFNNSLNETWMKNGSYMVVYLPINKNNTSKYTLKLEALSFFQPRLFQVFLNEKLINEELLQPSLTKMEIQMNLTLGDNNIRFYTPNGCQIPIDIMDSIDTRCISILFRNISVLEN